MSFIYFNTYHHIALNSVFLFELLLHFPKIFQIQISYDFYYKLYQLMGRTQQGHAPFNCFCL